MTPILHFRAWSPLGRAFPLCAPGPGDASPFPSTAHRSAVTCTDCLILLNRNPAQCPTPSNS